MLTLPRLFLLLTGLAVASAADLGFQRIVLLEFEDGPPLQPGFEHRPGETVWFNGTRPLPEDTTYSTPVISVLHGQAAMVFGSSDGVGTDHARGCRQGQHGSRAPRCHCGSRQPSADRESPNDVDRRRRTISN